MTAADDFFNRFSNDLVSGLYTSSLAKIEKYDKAGKADLSLIPDGDLLQSVPVATMQSSDYFFRVPYKEGDVVVVVFAYRDIDATVRGVESTASQRMLDINDAIIVGGINKFTEPLPEVAEDGIVFGAKDGSSLIKIKGGDVTIKHTGKLYLGDGATQGVPLGTALKTWIDNHVHEYEDSTGNGSSTKTTSKPSGTSPAPSTGVFVK